MMEIYSINRPTNDTAEVVVLGVVESPCELITASQDIAALEEAVDAAEAKVSEVLKAISDNPATQYLKSLTVLYPSWEELVAKGQKIVAEETRIIRDGVDANGNPRLYRVMLDTIPNPGMTPDKIATNFLLVGIGTSGYPLWVAPLWPLDAYKIGDKADRNGTVYINEQAENMREPGTENSGWRKAVATDLL
jgi:hypothetical protein